LSAGCLDFPNFRLRRIWRAFSAWASDIPNEVTVSPSTLLERSRQVGQDVCTAKQFLLVESIGFYAACAIDWDAGAFMSIGQAILFGMMLYWTPSVVLLAWLIWKERIGVKDV
jgi:hypothetical protein